MRVALVFMAVAAFLGAAVAQMGDLPSFPSLVETGVQGPENDILNGKPLKVPIIVDPFAKAPGSEAAEVMDRITQVLTMEPPSAAEPVVAAEDQVDILEVLNVAAEAQRKADAKKNASKKAKQAKKGGKKDDNKGSIKLEKKADKKDKKDAKKDAKKGAALPKDKAAAMKALKAEIGKLSGLIKKASKIQSELPKKRARLDLLKKKLHAAAASTAKDLAGKKAGAQSKAAGEVEGKIKELKDKLAKLEGAKVSLSKSIDGLQSVVKGKQVPASLIAEVESMI